MYNHYKKQRIVQYAQQIYYNKYQMMSKMRMFNYYLLKELIQRKIIMQVKNFDKSGNIVFPGGKCEDGQTDLVACLRETKQEIGIKLLENQQEHNTTSYLTLYLGKLTKNFFYRKHKNEYLYISCHVFVILNSNVTIILNTSQLIDSKWVKITDLIKPTNILFQQDKKSFISNFIPQKLFFLKNSIFKNLEYVRYPTLDVFLNRHLWGITFHIWMHCLRIIKFKLKQKNGYEQQQINKFIQQGEKFSIKFKWYYLPGYLIKHIGYDWNYRQRILQFQYPQLKQWKKNLKKIMVYSVFSLLVLPFSIYCIYFD